jgi:azurin
MYPWKQCLLGWLCLGLASLGAAPVEPLFQKDNLVAWCIVPYDAQHRSAEARAVMLEQLGIHQLAYDYRAEHVVHWEEELVALEKHHLELLAWWFPTEYNDEAKAALALFKKHGLKPQLWVNGHGGSVAVKDAAEQAARVAQEVKRLKPICLAAAEIGSKVGLYNHDGWYGEPENQLQILKALQAEGLNNVGMVYNFHHGHAHLERIAKLLPTLVPYLYCINLNGMDVDGPAKGRMILPLGVGTQDLTLLRAVRASGYAGPIGLMNHTTEFDAKARLEDNLDGLKWLTVQLDDALVPPKPKYRTWKEEPAKAAIPQGPAPAPFAPGLAPLRAEDNEWAKDFVNRDRIFDFYAKQAYAFRNASPLPELLPEYPGLDGGKQGHWGNQNDAVTWRDGRWGAADKGNLFSGVFRGAGLTIPKAVWVHQGQRSAVFDPLSLSFPIEWSGDFLKLGDMRHGFNIGASMGGPVVRVNVKGQKEPRPNQVYHGFYRHGEQVVFSYTIDGHDYLATAWEGQQEPAKLAALTKGGPTQWPQWLETKGVLGQQKPFATDHLGVPEKNPYGTIFFITGIDFFKDGSAAVCTMTGEVWLVRGIDADLQHLKWKRFATGLHHALGVKIINDQVYVLGRDQITRLHDLNGDDEADFYECVTNAMTTSPGGHDFIVGLDTDAQGRFYTASGNQGILRLTVPNQVEVLATGLRNPNGIGVTADGHFVVSQGQEGNWTPASALFQVELGRNEGAHFGAGGPRKDRANTLPLLQLPRGEDNSCGGQVYLSDRQWPDFQGNQNLIHLSFGTGSAWMVTRQLVEGVWQGAAVKLSGNFAAGAQHARFNPADGHLYVSGMVGWGSYAPRDGAIDRLRYTGGKEPVMIGHEVRDNGVLLHFHQPLEAGAATALKNYFAQMWNYRYSAAYGSPEFSVRYPGTVGHDTLAIRSVTLLQDGKTLFLEIPQLLPANQIHLHVPVTTEHEQDIFLTAHHLGEPFRDFPGYTKITKEHIHGGGELAVGKIQPVRWESEVCGQPAHVLHLATATGLQFAQKTLRVKAGEGVALTVENPDSMPHNWVLVKVGSEEKVGDLANRMVALPDGYARHYVPESSDVICHTRLLEPGKQTTIYFNAPKEPGRYPYFCSFPGHWQIMRGTLIVE